MPIRDMDMYATWQRQHSHSQATTSDDTTTATNNQGALDHGVGVPVGSNRGASGIDGVLSTAAGFAAGLKRSVTLTVGDVSFLHDINGLNLLRTGVCRSKHCHTLHDLLFYLDRYCVVWRCSVYQYRLITFILSSSPRCSALGPLYKCKLQAKVMHAGDMQPPLTVILINNGGGGIFSFLPIADAVMPEVFTPLWATPQNVDLAGASFLFISSPVPAQADSKGLDAAVQDRSLINILRA